MNLYFLIELGEVRCISLLVKSLKERKFVKTDAIQTAHLEVLKLHFVCVPHTIRPICTNVGT